MLTLAATQADTTVVAAFAVGFVSFVSPCVLPLVPGYLSAVSGVGVADLRSGEHTLSRVLGPAIIFCLSFTLMFVALGMTATGIGSTLNSSKQTLDHIAGVLIIAMGVFFVLTPFVPRLNREWRPETLIRARRRGRPGHRGAGLRGRAGRRASARRWPRSSPPPRPPTASATAACCSPSTRFGLAVPFLLTALAFNRATTAFRWIRDRYLIVTAVSGVVLILMGTLILTGELTRLNVEAQRFLDDAGLGVLYQI